MPAPPPCLWFLLHAPAFGMPRPTGVSCAHQRAWAMGGDIVKGIGITGGCGRLPVRVGGNWRRVGRREGLLRLKLDRKQEQRWAGNLIGLLIIFTINRTGCISHTTTDNLALSVVYCFLDK